MWVVTRNQYGISALVSQMSFGRETSGSVEKCQLFSQATLVGKCSQSGKEEEQLLGGQGLLFFGTLIVSNYYTNGFNLNNEVNVQIFSESGKNFVYCFNGISCGKWCRFIQGLIYKRFKIGLN